MSAAEPIRRFYDELWNEWRLDLAEEILLPDLRFRGCLGTSVVGIDAFKVYAELVRAAFPDWHNRVDEVIAAGDAVAARLTWTGTHRGQLLGVQPAGRRVEYPGARFFHVAGGRIASAWIVGDTQKLWRDLGVSAAGSRTG